MEKLSKKYLDVLEEQNWTVADYTGDGRVDLETESPAGEDFIICVEVKNLQDSVKEYASNFDVDEHIEMWVEAKKNGVQGVPSARELVHDAEAISEMLENLAIALCKARNNKRK